MASNPRAIAEKRVKEKKAFYYHLISFISANLFLFGLNLLTSPNFYWFLIPLMGWGVGFAIHYFTVFGIPGKGPLDEKWQAKEIEKELHRMGYQENDEVNEEDNLELKEFAKQKRSWDDSDLV